MNNLKTPKTQVLKQERWERLQQLEGWLDGPMLVPWPGITGAVSGQLIWSMPYSNVLLQHLDYLQF